MPLRQQVFRYHDMLRPDMSKVVIVDPGGGNIFSIARAIEAVGGEPMLSSDPHQVTKADRVILPGVGAFGNVMKELQNRHLVESIVEYMRRERPLLGICVGMQILFEFGEEYGRHNGIGAIAGRTAQIPVATPDGRSRRIPHIGWSPIRQNGIEWDGTLLGGIEPGAAFYFLHSYSAETQNANVLATVDFDGLELTAVVRSNNINGCQFHPERSGKDGLKIFEKFLKT
jgi:imidazole glycerol-phosphate synthase subunit HisH